MSLPARRPWLVPSIALGLGLLIVGCDQPTGSSRPRSRSKAVDPVAEQPAPPPPPAEAPREFIVGKRTQEIRDASAEKKAGGVVATQKITAKDPITLQGNAYVTSIGRISIDQITHALDLYHAETGEYPKTYDEFMENIIKKNNIALPKLPVYQKYAYDAPTHKLLVIEYPDLK
jgi:hypothetical protein